MPTKRKPKRYRYVAEVVVETDEPVTKKAVREAVEAALEGRVFLYNGQRPWLDPARGIVTVRREVDLQ